MGTSSAKKKKKGYKWQCEVRSVRVVVVATDLPQIASRVAKKTVASNVCGARGIPLFARLVLLPLLLRSLTQRVAESRPLSSSHSSQVTWKPTFSFQMMVRVGRRMTERLPVVMAEKRTAQTDCEGNVNRQTPQQEHDKPDDSNATFSSLQVANSRECSACK